MTHLEAQIFQERVDKIFFFPSEPVWFETNGYSQVDNTYAITQLRNPRLRKN
jgi:hypothetical protein